MGLSIATLSDKALEFSERVFAAGGLNHMDAVSFHPYQRELPDEKMVERIERLRAMMRKHGRDLPLVSSEVGWQGTDTYDPKVPYFPASRTKPPLSELQQAAVLTRSYVLNVAHGVVSYYWYKWHEERGNVGADIHGLVRGDWTYAPKAALVAMNALIERLHDARFVRRVGTPNPSQHIYEFSRPGQRLFVAWTVGEPAPVSLPTGARGKLFDLFGNPIGATRGPIKLTDSPVYVVR